MFHSTFTKVLLLLLIIGGLNWGSVGLFQYDLVGALFGGMDFRFFPSMKGVRLTSYSVSVFAAYFILCSIPMVIEFWEDRKWKATR